MAFNHFQDYLQVFVLEVLFYIRNVAFFKLVDETKDLPFSEEHFLG